MLDSIIRNCRIVTAAEILPGLLQIGVKDGKIEVIGHNLEGDASTEIIDAEGAYVTPGGVDSHAHVQQDNSPTGDTWETGSRSAIAGGNTTIIAFATQRREEESIWPALEAYHKKATGNSYCDYGFHLILSNPTEQIYENELPKLVDEGVTSLKLYMTYVPLKLGDSDLFNIMLRARSLGIMTMIHAENSDIIDQITRRLVESGQTDTFYHSVARPHIAESEATYRAISLAEVTDTPILIVHMSAPAAIEHVAQARKRLLPIHAEACPHYLYLTSEKLKSGPHDCEGAKHVCAPPLRHNVDDLDELWRSVANGTFTVISSDHAPATFDHPNGKQRGWVDISGANGFSDDVSHKPARKFDFRNVPNGLPGLETRLPLIFNRCYDPSNPPTRADRPLGLNPLIFGQTSTDPILISLPRFVALTSTNPAQLYGLAGKKGSIAVGFDADLVLWYPKDFEGGLEIRNEMLHHRIDYTPFEGMRVRNWPRKVVLRGEVVFDRDGGGVKGRMGDGVFLKRGKSSLSY
ncbi:D-hydantoinase [Polyplosphaeria fusca]|uniref:dihydropyrimidinase n=1 Tax=Polyplosphaeria fusca TaxID=682080 RepID=A0A9P4QWZ6_9PLEO|nr:D-hydantoinase [Polyplosphaeria fusca]